MSVISVNRRGQHNQIGIPHSIFGVDDVAVDGAQLNRCLQVLHTSPNSDDPCRQALSAKDHTERSADQPDSDNGDLSKMQRHSSSWIKAEPQS
jgi:hypothetical protein